MKKDTYDHAICYACHSVPFYYLHAKKNLTKKTLILSITRKARNLDLGGSICDFNYYQHSFVLWPQPVILRGYTM